MSFPAVRENACASDLCFKTHFDFSSLFSLMTLIITSLMSPRLSHAGGPVTGELSPKKTASICGRFDSNHIKYLEHMDSKPSACAFLTRTSETYRIGAGIKCKASLCKWRPEVNKLKHASTLSLFTDPVVAAGHRPPAWCFAVRLRWRLKPFFRGTEGGNRVPLISGPSQLSSRS